MRTLTTTILVAAALFGASEARAAPASQAFEVAAIGDVELDGIRGGAPLQPLTAYAVRSIAQDQARAEFSGNALLGRTIMDNWWNDVGAQLIVDSVTERALGR